MQKFLHNITPESLVAVRALGYNDGLKRSATEIKIRLQQRKGDKLSKEEILREVETIIKENTKEV